MFLAQRGHGPKHRDGTAGIDDRRRGCLPSRFKLCLQKIGHHPSMSERTVVGGDVHRNASRPKQIMAKDPTPRSRADQRRHRAPTKQILAQKNQRGHADAARHEEDSPTLFGHLESMPQRAQNVQTLPDRFAGKEPCSLTDDLIEHLHFSTLPVHAMDAEGSAQKRIGSLPDAQVHKLPRTSLLGDPGTAEA